MSTVQLVKNDGKWVRVSFLIIPNRRFSEFRWSQEFWCFVQKTWWIELTKNLFQKLHWYRQKFVDSWIFFVAPWHFFITLSGSHLASRLNSRRPKSASLTTQRESTRQFEDLRDPWYFITDSCKYIIPCQCKFTISIQLKKNRKTGKKNHFCQDQSNFFNSSLG